MSRTDSSARLFFPTNRRTERPSAVVFVSSQTGFEIAYRCYRSRQMGALSLRQNFITRVQAPLRSSESIYSTILHSMRHRFVASLYLTPRPSFRNLAALLTPKLSPKSKSIQYILHNVTGFSTADSPRSLVPACLNTRGRVLDAYKRLFLRILLFDWTRRTGYQLLEKGITESYIRININHKIWSKDRRFKDQPLSLSSGCDDITALMMETKMVSETTVSF